MSNVSLRTREHRVSWWLMTYIEMRLQIPTSDVVAFDRRFRSLLFEDVPIKHAPWIISELSRVYPKLKAHIPQRR